jgi:antitoxin component YwqK of YwqJK toxin-antitoxin module
LSHLYDSYYFLTNYINGKENEIYKKYHENGQLSCKVNFINEKRKGIYKSYHHNGQLWKKLNYIDDIQVD